MFKLRYLLVLVGLIFALAHPSSGLADSAVISANPSTGSYHTSDTFNVSIKVDSTGSSFNAAQAKVTVSSNLNIQALTFGDCNFAWIQQPSTTDPSFTGGIIQGTSSSCTVYTLSLEALSEGTGTIALTNQQVVNGTTSQPIPSSVTNGSYTISGSITPDTPTPAPTAAASPTPVLANTNSPSNTSSPSPSLAPKSSPGAGGKTSPIPSPSTQLAAKTATPSLSPTPSPKLFDLDIRVTSPDSPVIGAVVDIFSAPKEAITDSAGVAHFKGIDPGEHRIEVTYQGSTTGELITVSGSNPLIIADIELGKSSSGFSWGVVAGIAILVTLLVFWEVLLYNRRLSRRLRQFLYYDIIHYFRVRYVSLRYVRKVHFPGYRRVLWKRRLRAFLKYGIIHKYKLKLITYLYIPEVKKKR